MNAAKVDITLYHNPRCSKSREALALLRSHGIEPAIVEYLNTPPDAAQLARIVALLGIDPEALVRKGEDVFKQRFEVPKFLLLVGQQQKFGESQLPFAEYPETGRQGLACVPLFHNCRRERMKSRLPIAPQVAHRGHYQRKDRRQQRLEVIADEEILLSGFPHNGRGIDCVAPVIDRLAVKDRIFVLQRVVTVVIAEWAFRLALARLRFADQSEFGFSD